MGRDVKRSHGVNADIGVCTWNRKLCYSLDQRPGTSAVTEDIVPSAKPRRRVWSFAQCWLRTCTIPTPSVKGGFVFQRKAKLEAWADIPVPTALESKERRRRQARIDIGRTEEAVWRTGISLYDLYESEGIPLGIAKFIKANATIQALLAMSDDELTAVVGGHRRIGAEAPVTAHQMGYSDRQFLSCCLNAWNNCRAMRITNLNSAFGCGKS